MIPAIGTIQIGQRKEDWEQGAENDRNEKENNPPTGFILIVPTLGHTGEADPEYHQSKSIEHRYACVFAHTGFVGCLYAEFDYLLRRA